jgi:cyclic-di-GMP-binding protein
MLSEYQNWNSVSSLYVQWWAGKDSNLRRHKPADLQSAPFGRLGTDPQGVHSIGLGIVFTMPSFDIVSEVDKQELKNAVDQAQRELANRFDFKNTNSSIEQADLILTLKTSSEDRLRALKTLLEEKLVKRQVSLRGIEWGKIEAATGESVRQVVTVKVGINSDKAREINKLIKEKGPKGVSSQTQGEQVRVTSKKRDDLQEVMSLLKATDLELPLQFNNFRD